MQYLLNLATYPLHQPHSTAWCRLVDQCKSDLHCHGLFNLPGLISNPGLSTILEEIKPVLASSAFTHEREHNIYFKPSIEGLADDHPALQTYRTVNHTICADQISDSLLVQLYQWPPFATFLAAIMDKQDLFTMRDPLARVNVMSYHHDEALNWHFDRSEFTTTLLLQSPAAGGVFEYAKDLRSDCNPNYEEVAKLLNGKYQITKMPLEPGTLNVFRGKNTAHRVTPVEGSTERIVAVFSYFDKPDVVFSESERMGFYGRTS